MSKDDYCKLWKSVELLESTRYENHCDDNTSKLVSDTYQEIKDACPEAQLPNISSDICKYIIKINGEEETLAETIAAIRETKIDCCKKKMLGGTIAGIVVGSILVLTTIVLIVVFYAKGKLSNSEGKDV